MPGPESENGQLWVKTLGRLSGGLWTPPRETVELLRQRAFVLNTAVLGYVWLSSSDADDPQLLSAFPLNASRVSVIAIESFLFSKFFRRNANAGNRYALLTACHQIEWERGSAVATFDVFDRNFGVEHGAEDREVRCALPFPLGRRNLARTPCIRRRR